MSQLGAQVFSSKGWSFFGQDEFNYGRFTFNVGVRAEQWSHFATTGEKVFTFDWTWAPRLSAVYDLLGDGTQKVAGYYGRYYDPIRNDMTAFAGSLSGNVIEEQVFIDGQWLPYRVRAAPTQADAIFSPSTETPYTDEVQVQHRSASAGV